MLADELKFMLSKGFSLQYRQPSVSSYQSKTLYESPIARARTFKQNEIMNQDLWGGGRDAELGAWGTEEASA
jgi:hypothetical protein